MTLTAQLTKADLLHEAISLFDQMAEARIQGLAKTFDLDLSSPHPFNRMLKRQNDLWRGTSEPGWNYRFHGDACQFVHDETGQLVDVKINRKGHYGVLSPFYLLQFIQSTEALSEVSEFFASEASVRETLLELIANGTVVDLNLYDVQTLVLK